VSAVGVLHGLAKLSAGQPGSVKDHISRKEGLVSYKINY